MTFVLPDALRDPRRLAALRAAGILDTPSDPALDRLARLAALSADAPVAVIALADDHRQVLAGAYGLPTALAGIRETPLSHLLPVHELATGEPAIFEDARASAALRDGDAVRDYRVGAYVGVPLVTEEGHVLGALAAFDFAPRDWNARQLGAMIDLAQTVMHEVAMRQRLAEREREAERYRLAVRATREVVYDYDPARGTVRRTGALERLFGTDDPNAQEGTVEWWRARVHPDDAWAAVAALDRALRGSDETFLLEYRLRRPDGETVHVLERGSLVRDAEGRAVRMVGTMGDVTEQREAEARLRISEAGYRTLVEAAHEAVLAVDLTGTVTFANRRFGELLGYAREEVVGRPMFEFMEPDAAFEARTRFARRLRGINEARETQFVARDGRPVWMLESASTLYDDAGAVRGALFMASDVTARRIAEAQLRQAQKMEAVGQLAGGVAHDFNNLLLVIASHAQMALEDVTDDAPVREDLRAIGDAAHRAAELTRKLLAFSRKQVLKPEPVDLSATVAGLEGMLRRLIDADVGLVSDLAPGLPPVLADRGQLEQVILNLVVNARDAMPHGGTVTIETAAQRSELGDEPTPGGAELPPGEWVTLAVSDTGVGMDEETRQHIFEPFFTTKDPGKGTGLGLATVYGIVRQSNGHVGVESRPGRGSRFTVHLPAARSGQDAPVPATLPQLVHADARSGTGTVLVVEDEAPVRAAVRRMLERGGYTVLEAKHGADALALLDRLNQAVDLVLTDAVMPEMGASRFLHALRERLPGVPALVMSGYSEVAVATHGELLEGVELLAKPFEAADLLARVDATLRRVRAG